MSETSSSSGKRQNSACHFCDHAARRSGRHKVAEQVACSLENCRKVFCSRRACMAKLRGPGAPQTVDEFRHWKSTVECGQVFFVCPHCVGQGECQGPQCRKRGQSNSVGRHDTVSPSGQDPIGDLYMDIDRPPSAISAPVLALPVPDHDNELERYETSIQQVVGTAPFDFHRKRRKSDRFEVVAPIPIRFTPLTGQFNSLKIE